MRNVYFLVIFFFTASYRMPEEKSIVNSSETSQRTEGEAIILINKIYVRLETKKTTFCRESLYYSEDPETKNSCGQLGWKEPGALDKIYQETALCLEPGETSEPVKTSAGYEIINLVDKQDERTNTRRILITYKKEE